VEAASIGKSIADRYGAGRVSVRLKIRGSFLFSLTNFGSNYQKVLEAVVILSLDEFL
jgi:hypothetical protein